MPRDITKLKDRELLSELQRRALDLLIVHNPTQEQFVVQWNTSERHVIPPAGTDQGYGYGNQMVTRYIAEKYMTEMTNKLLTLEVDDEVKGENEKRRRLGRSEMTRYQGGEQFQMEGRIDDPVKRKEIMRVLLVRLEREYAGGYDEAVVPEAKATYFRGQDSELFDEIMGSIYNEGVVKAEEVEVDDRSLDEREGEYK